MIAWERLARFAPASSQVEFIKYESRERVGVGLSGKGHWPRVVNVAGDGLARGRLHRGDALVAVNGVQIFDEDVANRLIRESRGRIVLLIYRKRRGAAAAQQQRDDLTEIDGFSSSEQDLDELDSLDDAASESEDESGECDQETGESAFAC